MTPTDDSGTDHETFERAVGIRTHQLIAKVCDEQSPANRSLADVRRLASEVLREHPVRRGRNAAAQRMAVSAWRYCRDLAPPAPGFRLMAAEQRIGRARIDLVWVRDSALTIVFDEIKTGRWTGAVSVPQHDQVRAAIAAGQRHFGARFVGLRWLNVGDERGRFWVGPDGRWTPLRTPDTGPTSAPVPGADR